MNSERSVSCCGTSFAAEPALTSYSNLEPTAGTQIMRAGIELSKQLTPGTLPSRAKVAPWRGGGWTYGAVPP